MHKIAASHTKCCTCRLRMTSGTSLARLRAAVRSVPFRKRASVKTVGEPSGKLAERCPVQTRLQDPAGADSRGEERYDWQINDALDVRTTFVGQQGEKKTRKQLTVLTHCQRLAGRPLQTRSIGLTPSLCNCSEVRAICL